MAGYVIAFYQLGYGIAAFGVGPLQDAGASLPAIFGFTAFIAAAMALLSFFVAHRRPEPAGLPSAGSGPGRSFGVAGHTGISPCRGKTASRVAMIAWSTGWPGS